MDNVKETYQKALISNESHYVQKSIDHQTHVMNNQSDVYKENEMLVMRDEYCERRMLKYIKVTADKDGKLHFGLYDPLERRIKYSALAFKGREPEIRSIFTQYPTRKEALVVRGLGNRKIVFLDYQKNLEFDGEYFFKRLRSVGCELACKKAIWPDLANELFSFFMATILPEELPGMVGWNLMADGLWHYSQKGEKTFIREVSDSELV